MLSELYGLRVWSYFANREMTIVQLRRNENMEELEIFWSSNYLNVILLLSNKTGYRSGTLQRPTFLLALISSWSIFELDDLEESHCEGGLRVLVALARYC